MRRASVVLALTALVGTLAASAAAADKVQLTEAKGATFPERSFVLALPGTRALTTDDITVTENGNQVVDPSLVPASQVSKKTFGVVLVVDASQSMRGAPIDNAMNAARAFADKRNKNQQLALVTFNGDTTVAMPFTTSQDKIDTALSQVPPVAYGTFIYDAVAKAEAMLEKAKIQSGSIIVLSDGADTGSKATGAEVSKAARDARIKLYTIGLHSPKFDPKTLTSLAADSGGEYTLAKTTASLAPLYNQLSQRLASEYVVRYKSLAGPQVPVHVNVDVAGEGSATAAYETPALPETKVPPYSKSIGEQFWSSPLVMVVLALLVAAIIALFAYGLASTQGTGLPQRMVEFVSVPGLQKRGQAAQVEDEQQAQKPGLFARMNRSLEIAQIHMSAGTYILWTVVATVLAFLVLIAITGSFWWSLFALLVPLGAREFAVRKLARRRNQFAEQLPDALQVVSSALRSGHSFAGALAVVVESSSDPMKAEMHRVVADEQLGIPLEQSIEVVAERMDNRDLEQVGLVAQLQREAGSNAAEVVDRVAETIRERFELRRLVKTLTAQGRMSRWIVSAIPIVILLILQVINPHYLHPLVSTTVGKVVVIFAAALAVAGSLVIKKIVDIKV